MKTRYWIAGATGLAGAAVAVKMLTRPKDVEWAEHAMSLHHAERSRFADVEGLRLHYQEAGERDAPVIILIHGFTASTIVWSEVLMPIADAGFRVIAVDLPGFGFSAKPPDGDYTIEWHARLIMGLMDELGIQEAALVGNSYGGAIAACLRARLSVARSAACARRRCGQRRSKKASAASSRALARGGRSHVAACFWTSRRSCAAACVAIVSASKKLMRSVSRRITDTCARRAHSAPRSVCCASGTPSASAATRISYISPRCSSGASRTRRFLYVTATTCTALSRRRGS